ITSSISVDSTAGDVTVTGLVDARDSVTMLGTDLNIMQDAHVFAQNTGAQVLMDARDELYVQSSQASGNSDGLVYADNLLHLRGGSVQIDGIVKSLAANSQMFIHSADDLIVRGLAQSAGSATLAAGVSRDATLATLRAGVTTSNLLGGNVRILGQGMVEAVGNASVQAGQDVIISADSTVAGTRVVQIPVI